MTKKEFNAVVSLASESLDNYDYSGYLSAVHGLEPWITKKLEKIVCGQGLAARLITAKSSI